MFVRPLDDKGLPDFVVSSIRLQGVDLDDVLDVTGRFVA